MPHTNDALREDAWAQHLGPLHQAAAAGACVQPDSTHWELLGTDCVMLRKSFEPARKDAGALWNPVAGDARRYDAARRLAQRSRDPAGTSAYKAEPGVPADIATAMRVLMVEDDAIIGTLLAEMLASMGHDVCAIEATEADAVRAAARCKPDLMIVDISLVEGNGISAIETIHRTGPVPHVFVSADASRARALRPGSIFIRKPYRETDLARVIQQALDAVPLH
jgi:two-component system, response regulator PdtaR